MRIRKALSVGLLALAPALTGCLVHTHTVLKTKPPTIVLGSSLDQLLKQVGDRYDSIQSVTASAQFVGCSGGGSTGDVTCATSFSGFIIIGKPENIEVLLKVPYLGSDALHMVSDGKSFKMYVPPESCAIYGSDIVTNSQLKGKYALRPAMVLDSLLIHSIEPDQLVAMTQDSRTLPDPKTRKDVIVEPDYDLQFLSPPDGRVAHALRVIHIGRATLLPYQQDIYDADGKVATQAFYDGYKKFGDINFPTKIVIKRPLDEFTLTITISKAVFNQKLDPDQFNLDIPENTPHMVNMDDPASATVTNPCGVNATQSKH